MKTNKQLEVQWSKTVYNNATARRELADLHWYPLAIGWLLAKGLNVNEAVKLALDWRYKKHIA